MRSTPLLAACLLSVVGCGTDTSEMGVGGGVMCRPLGGIVSSALASSGTDGTGGADVSSASASSSTATAGSSSSSTSSAAGGGSPTADCCRPDHTVESTADVTAGERGDVVARCNDGAPLLIGGCDWGGTFPIASLPMPDGWRCIGDSNGSEDAVVRAVAVCGAP